jgi:adenine-specific DNA-methyltransferase
MLKYLRLESYEDTLDNLELRRPAEMQALLDESPTAHEDYLLHYMLAIETRESASLLDVQVDSDRSATASTRPKGQIRKADESS